MAVLITGAAGFVGSALARRFADTGYEVVATDFTEPDEGVRNLWQDRVQFVRSDIRDAAGVAQLVEETGAADPIVHMAGLLTAGCDRDPDMAIEVNVKGFLNILRPVCGLTGRTVVLASTIGVYGRGLPQPITETMAREPDGWYGLSKLTAEEMGLLYARRNRVDFRALRLAAVTGSGRKAASGSASLFTSFIPEKAALGEPYDIEVTPDTAYPVVYIKDAVEALFIAATAPQAPGRIYNVSSGRVFVDKLVDSVLKRIPDATFNYRPVEDIMAVVAGYKEWEIDCSRAREELAWTPKYGVEAMVKDIIDTVEKRKTGV